MPADRYCILYLGNKLMKHGYTPTSIETLGQMLADRYDMIYASSFKNPVLRLLHMMLALIWNARRIDAVIIDTYSLMAFHYAWLCGGIAKILGIAYIPVLRGGDLPIRLERSPKLCQRFFGNAYANVVPSAYLLQHFRGRFQRLVFLPNNIPLRNYPYQLRERLRPLLLYVRAFQKVYNPTMAIEVLAKLSETHPDARLCMVGPDKDQSQAEVEALAKRYGLEDRLEITGRLEKPIWIAKSTQFDIFINTTNVDNHPVSVTEAMALGLPVVSTNAGGLPNLIEHGKHGLLVDCGDVSAMVEAIESLLADPEKAQTIAKNARDKVAQFDWDVLKLQWYQLLDRASQNQPFTRGE